MKKTEIYNFVDYPACALYEVTNDDSLPIDFQINKKELYYEIERIKEAIQYYDDLVYVKFFVKDL